MAGGTRFVRIAVRARDAGEAERAAAEMFGAGASGIEERAGESGRVTLYVYAPATAGATVRRAACAALGGETAVGEPEAVPERDWSEAWKRGLGPIAVTRRLVVRPSFAPAGATPGVYELVIDPGQAFGTGSHASTRLALEWIDALAAELPAGGRALDLGTGSGVLALALAALAPCRVVACDVDPLASAAARDAARRNGLAERVDLFTGSAGALADAPRFDLVVANLLRSELTPLLEPLARRTRPGGRVVLAGLLVEDRDEIADRAARAGLALRGERERADASGSRWWAPLMRRERDPANPPARDPACG